MKIRFGIVLVVLMAVIFATPGNALVWNSLSFVWGEQTGHCYATFTGYTSVWLTSIEEWYYGSTLIIDVRIARCFASGWLGPTCFDSTQISTTAVTQCDTTGGSKCGPYNSPTARNVVGGLVDTPGSNDPEFLDFSACQIVDCTEWPF